MEGRSSADPCEESGARSNAKNPTAPLGRMSELQNLATSPMAPEQCDWLPGQGIMMDGGNAATVELRLLRSGLHWRAATIDRTARVPSSRPHCCARAPALPLRGILPGSAVRLRVNRSWAATNTSRALRFSESNKLNSGLCGSYVSMMVRPVGTTRRGVGDC
jgi:hypothetical protein